MIGKIDASGRGAAETVEVALARLRVNAPDSFLTNVLEVVGIAFDRYVMVESPVGPLLVAFNPYGISFVTTAAAMGAKPRPFETVFRERHGRDVLRTDNGPADLARALDGGSPDALTYDLRCTTPFGRAVLAKATEIPPGHVRSYAWIARQIGRPRAIRAVASALRRNPVPVLIPCHRVIRSDGRIGQYVFGASMKRALLEHEGIDIEELVRPGAPVAGWAAPEPS